jgi:HD superfamily phosphodiesterase
MSRNMIHQYVKDLTGDRLVSGYGHCYRVYHLARELDIKDYDDDILFAACFLHDLVANGADENLIYEQSAMKAEQLMHEVGFPPEKIDKVVECIRTHHLNNPTLIEAQLLHDANLLDSLGAIGIIRLSIGAFFWYHLKNLREVLDLIKSFRKKSETLIFPKSKELAKIKVDFMDKLIEEMDKEQHL